MKRLLYVHNKRTRFVAIDHEALAGAYQVDEYQAKNPLSAFFGLFDRVRKADVVFGWFASWHTFPAMFWAKVLGKPSVQIIGGYDLAKMPEINYGHQRGGWRKIVSRWTMALARRLVTNSVYSQDEAEQNADLKRESVTVVYHGLPDPFAGEPAPIKENLILTVGNVDRANLIRKGIEPFVRAAAKFPDYEFAVVGARLDDAVDHLKSIATDNVTFPGRVDDETLLNYYRRSKLYLQLSGHEGFGMSLAEAMLARSIPVATRAGAIPEVVGDTGVFVDSIDEAAVTEGIQKAFQLDPTMGDRARERVVAQFPLHARANNLIRIVKETEESFRK